MLFGLTLWRGQHQARERFSHQPEMQPFKGLKDQPKNSPRSKSKQHRPPPPYFALRPTQKWGRAMVLVIHGVLVSIPAHSRSKVAEKEPLVVLRSTHLKWFKGNKGTSQNQSPLQVGFRFFPSPSNHNTNNCRKRSTTRRRRKNRAEGAPGL